MTNPLRERHVATIEPLPASKRAAMKLRPSTRPEALSVVIPVDSRIPGRKTRIKLVGAKSGDVYEPKHIARKVGRVAVAVDPGVSEPLKVFLIVTA